MPVGPCGARPTHEDLGGPAHAHGFPGGASPTGGVLMGPPLTSTALFGVPTKRRHPHGTCPTCEGLWVPTHAHSPTGTLPPAHSPTGPLIPAHSPPGGPDPTHRTSLVRGHGWERGRDATSRRAALPSVPTSRAGPGSRGTPPRPPAPPEEDTGGAQSPLPNALSPFPAPPAGHRPRALMRRRADRWDAARSHGGARPGRETPAPLLRPGPPTPQPH